MTFSSVKNREYHVESFFLKTFKLEQFYEARDESSLLIDPRRTGQETLKENNGTLCLLTGTDKDLCVQNCCFLQEI